MSGHYHNVTKVLYPEIPDLYNAAVFVMILLSTMLREV